VTTQNLLLKLYLPERFDEAVPIDRPLNFYVLVGDGESDAAPIGEDGAVLRIDPGEIEAMRLGWVELELIPRGVGEIEVRAQNLYHEIDPGGNV